MGAFAAGAIELETSLIAPAKAELGGLFLEAESTYSKYLATVNELGAKQGKERLQKKVQGEEKAERAHEKVEELLVRKAQMEQERLPKLEAIAECAEAGLAFLLERHRAFRTAFFGVAQLAASNPQAADAEAARVWPIVLGETEAGWTRLHNPELMPKPKLQVHPRTHT